MITKEPVVSQACMPSVGSIETGVVVCFLPCRLPSTWKGPGTHSKLAE